MRAYVVHYRRASRSQRLSHTLTARDLDDAREQFNADRRPERPARIISITTRTPGGSILWVLNEKD